MFPPPAPPSASVLTEILHRHRKHETKHKRHLQDMFPETRQLLNEFFATFNQDLAQITGDTRFLFDTPYNLDSHG